MQPTDENVLGAATEAAKASFKEQMDIILSDPNKEKIAIQRNYNYAIGCLAIIAILFLIPYNMEQHILLNYGFLCLCVGFPLVLWMGLLDEYFIYIGEKSYKHYQTIRTSALALIINNLGLLAVGAGFTLVIFHVSVLAGWLSIIAFIAGMAGCMSLYGRLINLYTADRLAEMKTQDDAVKAEIGER